MRTGLRRLALRLKVIELLSRYSEARQNVETMAQWKKLLIHSN
ncbi:MAG: hypothetical protein VX910_05530 [Candidatus Latescibacterota bacterium]|nr:hypothetical protein [Candidatus Latescibacterota bacterium]